MLLLGIIIAFLFISIITIVNAGSWLVKNNSPMHSDIIVMLMGDITDRILHTFDLYQKGYSDCIILVEENMGSYRQLEDRGASIISNTAQCRSAFLQLGVPSTNVICLPGDARSTQDEAIIIRDYLSLHQEIKTLLLVSSAQHTRRASIIFGYTFKKKTTMLRFLVPQVNTLSLRKKIGGSIDQAYRLCFQNI